MKGSHNDATHKHHGAGQQLRSQKRQKSETLDLEEGRRRGGREKRVWQSAVVPG